MDPKYTIVDAEAISWQNSEKADGVEIKKLCGANDYKMVLYRFAPNTSYPVHYHQGPEF